MSLTWFNGKAAGERNKRSVHSKRRALREKAATPEWDVGIDRRAIWEIYGKCCHLCKLPVDFERMHLDHVLPLSQGGLHEQANLAPAHEKCNTSKGDRVGPKKKKGLRRTAFKPKKKPKLPDDPEMF